MDPTLATMLVAFAGVLLISFMKGAFGGGFAIVGIPLLSTVMDPITASGLLAPLFIAMDLYGLRYWKPSTWSKPDLKPLLPGLVVGIGFGYLAFRFLDHRAIAIVMAAITLVFVGLWLLRGAEVTLQRRSTPKAVAAGFTSGVTTMVAHSGGPPLAMYLLPLGLGKELYAGQIKALAARFDPQLFHTDEEAGVSRIPKARRGFVPNRPDGTLSDARYRLYADVATTLAAQ